MKKLIFSTFLLLVFLLSSCAYLEGEYDHQIEHAVVDNGTHICEYVKGVKINCYLKGEQNEKEKI